MTILTTGMVSMTLILEWYLNDLNNIQLRLGLYKVSMTNLIQHFYGIYDKIYDWNGIYDLKNIQLIQGL